MSDPGERTWTLYVCPACEIVDNSPLPHRHGKGHSKHDLTEREAVSVVEQSRLLQAQAERDRFKTALQVVADSEASNAEVRLAREVLGK